MTDLEWLRSAAIAVAAGIVSAILTLWVSVVRFRSERWWERKAETYSDILARLVDAERYTDLLIRKTYGEVQPSDQYLESFQQKSGEAWQELRRVAAMGSFLIADDAVQTLGELWKRDDRKPQDLIRMAEQDHADLRAAIRSRREIAKADLGMSRRWWRRFFG